MKDTTLYKFGLKYKGILYGWKDKKLYRLPYTKDKRSYKLKEIPFYVFKSTTVCNLQRDKVTFNKLKFLTEEINVEINSFEKDFLPF